MTVRVYMEDFKNELVNNCIVCRQKDSKKKPCVKKPEGLSLLNRCQELKDNGDHSVSALLQRLRRAQEEKLLDSIRYHSQRRKTIMHEKRKISYSESSASKTPSKVRVGRPAIVSPENNVIQRIMLYLSNRKTVFITNYTLCGWDPF